MSKQIKGTFIPEMEAEHLSETKAQETLKLMLNENTRLHEKDTQKKQIVRTKYLRYAPVFAAAAACIIITVALIHPGQNANKGTGKPIEYGSVQLSSLPSGIISRGESGDDLEAAFGISGNDLFKGWTVTDTTVYSSGGHKQAFIELQKDDMNITASVSDIESALYSTLGEINAGTNGARFNLDPSTNELNAVFKRSDLWIVLTADNIGKADFEAIVR